MMTNTKIIELLGVLSSKELRLLKQFVGSPYFNRDKILISFLEVLTENFSSLKKEKITKEKIFEMLLPGKEYDDLKMRHLTSRLYALCLQFLNIERISKNEMLMSAELLDEFRMRKMDKEFISQYEKSRNQIDQSEIKTRKIYYFDFLLHAEYSGYIESQHKREQEPNLQNVSDSLDTFYLVEKLRLYCRILSYKTIIKHDYSIGLMEEILGYLGGKDLTSSPLVYVYYKAVQMMLNRENEIYFFELRDYLKTNIDFLEKEEQENLLVLCKNYCIRKLNAGATTFIKELFELYKIEFDAKPGGDYSISPLTYKNVVAIALKIKEFDWIRNFIESYHTYLPAAHKESVYNYNLARYFFSMGEFLKVTGFLNKVDPKDIFLHIDSKLLLLKTYYERKDELAMIPVILTLRKFIKRKSKLSYHRNSYLNFLTFLEKIADVNDLSSGKKESLAKQIAEQKELADKEWLLEKILG